MKGSNVSLLTASLLVITLWGIASAKSVNSMDESDAVVESPESTGLVASGHKVERRGLGLLSGVLVGLNLKALSDVEKALGLVVTGLVALLAGGLLVIAGVLATLVATLSAVVALLLARLDYESEDKNCGKEVKQYEGYYVEKDFEKLDYGDSQVSAGVSGDTNYDYGYNQYDYDDYGYGGANNAKTNAKQSGNC